MLVDPLRENDNQAKILTVSAILRVIHGAINFFIEPETKKHALQQMKNVQITQPLTELCSMVGWTQANIATKYLSIMQELLEELQFESEESVIKDILDILSKVVAEILKTLNRKLQNVEKAPLSHDDNTLIFNLSSCCALMCARVASMRLLKDADMTIMVKSIELNQKKAGGNHSMFSQKSQRQAKQMVARFLLAKLVPLHVIYALLDIVLINMAKYANPKNISIADFEMADITNRAISILLAEYFTNCLDHKYSILKYFTDVRILFCAEGSAENFHRLRLIIRNLFDRHFYKRLYSENKWRNSEIQCKITLRI